MDYQLKENEDYRDFVYRSCKGQVDEDERELLIFLLEMIVSEIPGAAYSLLLTISQRGLVITIVHDGQVIKDDIVSIIEDQVDYLSYRHLTKDKHILKIRMKKRKKLKVNYLIMRQL